MARKPPVRLVAHKRKILRRAGVILAAGIGHPWVTGTVARAIPFGRSVTASVVVAATVNRPIPFGRSISAAGGAIPGRANHAVVVHRKPPKRRLGTITIQATGLPPQSISATLARAIPFGRTITGSAIDSVLPGSGSMVVARPVRHKRARRITLRVAPAGTVVGSSAIVNRAIPFGRSITAGAQVSGRVARAIPFGRSASATVRVDAALARAIPFGRSISATSGQATPTQGTPTSGIVADNGVRSGIVSDAGRRSGILSDNGRRSGIVNNPT